MSKELVIEPMKFYGPGLCPECSSELLVVDSELSLVEVTPEGWPISDEINIRCEGFCPKCGYRLPMFRSFGYYIPDTPYNRYEHDAKMNHYKSTRKKELEVLRNENPLAL